MYGISDFETFVIAGILLNITPGSDTMYILGRIISQGKTAGILSALGISTGGLIHCISAVLGLSVILTKSAIAFGIIKYLGVIYLVFLGIKSLTTKPTQDFEIKEKEQDNNPIKIYISGIFTNIFNPKVAIFFLAFLPQFIDSRATQSPLPFIILGITFLFTGTIWCLTLAFFAAKLSDKIRRNYKIKNWLDKITGLMFIMLGIKLAFAKK
ncbi:LysE family translocator [Xanthovirga aplysinae]|uniref:LysE family translocator n=1 Tax=Xanthovirga aplysinae TaxID=2529853 RepID=UPI0012BBCE88|nr:LysE family translocator [Xanthovirga aplysinae]MTI29669.1 LysE family translocator [Xanthovirga aplysinae]